MHVCHLLVYRSVPPNTNMNVVCVCVCLFCSRVGDNEGTMASSQDELGARKWSKVGGPFEHHQQPQPSGWSSSASTQNVVMDSALWGNLQQFINLEMVYAKLPLQIFYQLRCVCSAWNVLAGNRHFLEQYAGPRFPKPYFILFGAVGFWCHHVMLVYDVELCDWVRKPLPHFAFKKGKTVVADGFVYSATSHNPQQGTVFNIHTKARHNLPTLYEHDSSKDTVITLSEIAVDKNCGTYKLLVTMGYPNMQTYVYESISEKWTLKSAELSRVKLECGVSVHCNGILYIKSRRHMQPALIAYDFEHDSWTSLPHAPYQRCVDGHHSGLGQWKGVLYDVTGDDEGLIRVWEFLQSGLQWCMVDSMPDKMHLWLKPEDREFQNRYLVKTFYCEEYILMCPMEWTPECLTKFVIYNIALKTWSTVEVPKDSKDALDDDNLEMLVDYAMDKSNGCVSADDVQMLIEFAGDHPNENFPWM